MVMIDNGKGFGHKDALELTADFPGDGLSAVA